MLRVFGKFATSSWSIPGIDAGGEEEREGFRLQLYGGARASGGVQRRWGTAMTPGVGINDPRRGLGGWHEGTGERPGFGPAGEPVVIERRASGRPEDSPALTVGDVMTRNVRTCRPENTLAAAAVAMCEADCRFLPVVDEAGHPVGVVTDGDVCLLGSTSHRRLSDMFVREAMRGAPVTCGAGDAVLDALRIMRERRIRHLPVVRAEGLLEGVVSLTDLILCAAEESSPLLRREVAAALRALMQKHGDQRIIEHNPFVED